MALSALPVRIAIVVAAAAWPLAAALAVVTWSRARAARQAARVADLDARLSGLYRTVELRGAPAQLVSLADALEADAALEPPMAARAGAPGASPAQPLG